VHQLADLAADGLLPVRERVDVGIDALVGGVRYGCSSLALPAAVALMIICQRGLSAPRVPGQRCQPR
jgi:hypothetical protein